MRMLPALLLLSFSSSAHATVTIFIDFSQPGGNLGTTETYTSGPLTVTASGFSASNVAKDLYGKQGGGNESGLGFATNRDKEIGFGEGYVQLDVKGLFGKITDVKFGTNSTTQGEQWSVYGSNTAGLFASGSFLSKGTTEGLHSLPSFGSYNYYYFASTKNKGGKNYLITGLSGTPAVPEPTTWGLMLLGFGCVGGAMRSRRRQKLTVSYS